jgi:hypothetical protein
MTGAGPWPQDVMQCRTCKADIVWLRTKAGKSMPVNVQPTAAPFRGPTAGETAYKHGEHQSHFVTCPQRDEHRRSR